ncbi:MAG: hypothetical protein LC749_19245, partial [Actinobacteria bacterium]|nr:hypothetical protein [Actinomycetota bacterium]
MAAEHPLTELALRAGSLADDLGFVALGDLAQIVPAGESRVIGGQMVAACLPMGPRRRALPRDAGHRSRRAAHGGEGPDA